jgi:hypothetical protein
VRQDIIGKKFRRNWRLVVEVKRGLRVAGISVEVVEKFFDPQRELAVSSKIRGVAISDRLKSRGRLAIGGEPLSKTIEARSSKWGPSTFSASSRQRTGIGSLEIITIRRYVIPAHCPKQVKIF